MSFYFSVILKSLCIRFRIRSEPSRASRPTVWETPTHAMYLHESQSREWKWWHCSWGHRGWEAFFCTLHKCAMLLNTWPKFKRIKPLSYSSLEEIELSFIRKVTSFVYLLIISQCDLPSAVTLLYVFYITCFLSLHRAFWYMYSSLTNKCNLF